eukprot:772445-Prymnesium_polylepis.1
MVAGPLITRNDTGARPHTSHRTHASKTASGAHGGRALKSSGRTRHNAHRPHRQNSKKKEPSGGEGPAALGEWRERGPNARGATLSPQPYRTHAARGPHWRFPLSRITAASLVPTPLW